MAFTDKQRTFLEQPRIARVTTIDESGYPHTVPTWFDVDGEELVFSLQRQRVRLKHIKANPKGAVTVGGDPGDNEGYLFKGQFYVVEDPDHSSINKMIHRYLSGEAAEQFVANFAASDSLLVRFRPEKDLKVR